MAIAAQPTEVTSVTARCRRDASIGRYRARTSVLAPAAVKDYHHFFQLPTGDPMPL
jgi:hypothetical protein